ncbi:rhomboid family intramembrane serine protease [Salinarimonas ramus]|uniref:Rhomboid family intramembrane serine protease n=1 Tax=Salinarimonas ramus TaxID=690164 RepID=A0A917Q9I1_9HYPH|nr:rhomboid family intramembrane serine protease [Salinarimonas ramus]GGK37103.1 rhomboid family intramembrane serine protease [Salinarimonas ramus]
MLVIGDDNPLRHIGRAWVNHALIGVMIVAFLAGPALEGLMLFPAQVTGVADLGPEIDAVPAWARLVGYAFLHAGLLHIAGNLITLWVFGDNVEDAMGHVRYVLFFVLAAVAGGLAEAYMTSDPTLPVVGASGAVSGVMGAYLMLHPRAKVFVLVGYRVPVAVPAGIFVGFLIALNLLMALSGAGEGSMVAWWAHLGGFAAGMILVVPLRHRDVALFQPAHAFPERTGRFASAKRFAERFVIDLTPKRSAGIARSFSDRTVAVIKALAFFIGITLVVELFVP